MNFIENVVRNIVLLLHWVIVTSRFERVTWVWHSFQVRNRLIFFRTRWKLSRNGKSVDDNNLNSGNSMRFSAILTRKQMAASPTPNQHQTKTKTRRGEKTKGKKKPKRIFSRSLCLLTRPLSDPAGYPVKSRRILLHLHLLHLLCFFFLFSTFGADRTFFFKQFCPTPIDLPIRTNTVKNSL